MKKKSGIMIVFLVLVGVAFGVVFLNGNNKTKSEGGLTASSDVETPDQKKQDTDETTSTSSEQELPASTEPASEKTEEDTNKDDNTQIDHNYFALPYDINDTGLVIKKIGSYDGIYVEDGSNKKVENVLAMTIENTSDKAVEYSSLVFQVSNGKEAEFKITLLPPGEKIIVFELNKMKYKKSYQFELKNETTAYLDSKQLSLLEDKVSIVGVNKNQLTITNLTEKKIKTLRVFYKYQYEDGTYVGGVTFTSKISDLKGKESITITPEHYETEGCRVLRVEEYEQ